MSNIKHLESQSTKCKTHERNKEKKNILPKDKAINGTRLRMNPVLSNTQKDNL